MSLFIWSRPCRAQGPSTKGKIVKSEKESFLLEDLASLGDVPWGMAFVAPDTALITLRGGKLVLLNLKTKELRAVSGGPRVIRKGQGGLLDVAVHPKFDKNGWVYFTYSTTDKVGYTTALARAQLAPTRNLTHLTVLFTAKTESETDLHFGSRIVFDDKGYLFMSVGDRDKRKKLKCLTFTMVRFFA